MDPAVAVPPYITLVVRNSYTCPTPGVGTTILFLHLATYSHFLSIKLSIPDISQMYTILESVWQYRVWAMRGSTRRYLTKNKDPTIP